MDDGLPTIEADDFARRFSMRSGRLMWFLGAGASASAGIPTAWHMIWEFKQRLYVTQNRVPTASVSDLSNPAIRAQLQLHIDSAGNLPLADDPDEYSRLFEAVFPSEDDRRAYIDSKITGAQPSYGHVALATLMHAQFTRLVWTTNFDPLIADACARVFGGTGHLTTGSLDAPDLPLQAIQNDRWPVEVKLHGDFRSRRLKNTDDELREQDARLRATLVDCCRRFGLGVVGYSGRDDSVMDALAHALECDTPFPNGLFWFHRRGGRPMPRVVSLLQTAARSNVEAALVEVESFDELLRDLVRVVENVDSSELDNFARDRRRWTPSPQNRGKSGWPVIRMNAIEVVQRPTQCRRVECSVGGTKEVREAIESAGVDVLAIRSRAGVLAFGSDAARDPA